MSRLLLGLGLLLALTSSSGAVNPPTAAANVVRSFAPAIATGHNQAKAMSPRSGNTMGSTQPYTNEFSIDASAVFSNLLYTSAAWGDYNNDGNLDVAVMGCIDVGCHIESKTLVYAGDGQGGFILDATANLIGGGVGTLVWGDYNNDGNLDLLVSGYRSYATGLITWLYTGDGHGGFVLNTAANLPGLYDTSVAWGDYNNDGKPDLALSGCTTANIDCTPISEVFAGDGSGNFTPDTAITLQGVDRGTITWGDYNNDGNLDLLLAGSFGSTKVTQIYQGDGHGGFTPDTAANLPLLANSNAAWGDYNNDGNLDLAIAGVYSGTDTTQIYAGDGHGNFTLDAATGLIGMEHSTIIWGDYNNDGNLDLLIAGCFSNSCGSTSTLAYRGDGQGGFTRDYSGWFESVNQGSVTWGDYDNDGRLDVLLSGNTGTSTSITHVYHNDATVAANQPPTAPIALSVSNVTAISAQLNWHAPSDDHTITATLSYNLRVGTSPGASDVVNPLANTSVLTEPNGLRRIPAIGNAQLGLTALLGSLTPCATYYWSVQAIDQSFAGGPFAAEQQFTTPCATSTPTLTATPTNTPILVATATDTPTSISTPAPTNTPAASTTPTDCPNPFVDITGNVFYGAIHSLNCRGVVSGIDPTHYGPGGSSTRGQFAKVVVLGFGIPLSTPATPSFTDVPSSYFAYVYIESGFANGVLSGFDQAGCAAHGAVFPCYLPNLAITRGQLTKLVVSAGHYALYTPTTPDFTDVPASNVFYVSIETAFHNSVVGGYPDHSFRPNNNVRRDEMAQIVFEGVAHMP